MAKVKKGGLGRGLDSLIPDLAEPAESVTDEIQRTEKEPAELKLNINRIEPNRDQPRKDFNEEALQELADSIRQFGILQPLLVQPKNDYYEIIAGERRWRAAKLAGLKELPVIMKEYSDREVKEISLIENIQRENLNPIEEAMAYQSLLKEFELTQEEIAGRVSKSRAAITNTMRLLKLDQRVQNMIVDKEISSGHGRTLLSIEDGNQQFILAQKIVNESLSVREVEKLVKGLLEPVKEPVKEPEKKENLNEDKYDIFYKQVEDKMKSIMGTKVSINKKDQNKGRIEIEYYSPEELERLIELFESIHHE